MKTQIKLLAASLALAVIAPLASIEPAKADSVRVNGCIEGICFDSDGNRYRSSDYRYRNSRNNYRDYDDDDYRGYRRPRYRKTTYYGYRSNSRGYDYYYNSGGNRYHHRKDGKIYLYFGF